MPSRGDQSDLWSLVDCLWWIRPATLWEAVQAEASGPDPDYRTRHLIHDALHALAAYWGEAELKNLLQSAPGCDRLRLIYREQFEDDGFPSLKQRIMETTKRDTVLQFFRDLGDSIGHHARIDVVDSTALILRGLLRRQTEVIDVADDVPAVIREDHELLRRLSSEYGLAITHFQSHYLPDAWENRLTRLDRFGRLDVYLVDEYDIFVGKLFSRREKDRQDLRSLVQLLDRAKIEQRVRSSTPRLRADEQLRAAAAHNWYVIFGDRLPNHSDSR